MNIENKAKEIVHEIGCDSPFKVQFLATKIKEIINEVESDCARKYADELKKREESTSTLLLLGQEI